MESKKKEPNLTPLLYILVFAIVALILTQCYVQIVQANANVEISKIEAKNKKLEQEKLELELSEMRAIPINKL